jgi:hypothetical protein
MKTRRSPGFRSAAAPAFKPEIVEAERIDSVGMCQRNLLVLRLAQAQVVEAEIRRQMRLPWKQRLRLRYVRPLGEAPPHHD